MNAKIILFFCYFNLIFTFNRLFWLFKAKSDAINILSDLLTPETDNNEILSNSINFESSLTNVLEHSVRIAIDINRHKEVRKFFSLVIYNGMVLLIFNFRLLDNG